MICQKFRNKKKLVLYEISTIRQNLKAINQSARKWHQANGKLLIDETISQIFVMMNLKNYL